MARIRPMAAADRPAVVSMLCDLTAAEIAFEPDRRADPASHALYLAEIEARIAAADGIVLVAEGDGGALVGVAAANVEEDDPYIVEPFRRFVYVSDIVVVASERGRGHGRRLLDAIRTWAAARGYRRMKIGALQANLAARSLYQGFGFRPYVTTYELTLPSSEQQS